MAFLELSQHGFGFNAILENFRKHLWKRRKLRSQRWLWIPEIYSPLAAWHILKHTLKHISEHIWIRLKMSDMHKAILAQFQKSNVGFFGSLAPFSFCQNATQKMARGAWKSFCYLGEETKEWQGKLSFACALVWCLLEQLDLGKSPILRKDVFFRWLEPGRLAGDGFSRLLGRARTY